MFSVSLSLDKPPSYYAPHNKVSRLSSGKGVVVTKRNNAFFRQQVPKNVVVVAVVEVAVAKAENEERRRECVQVFDKKVNRQLINFCSFLSHFSWQSGRPAV